MRYLIYTIRYLTMAKTQLSKVRVLVQLLYKFYNTKLYLLNKVTFIIQNTILESQSPSTFTIQSSYIETLILLVLNP
jgi:hypothetical protein